MNAEINQATIIRQYFRNWAEGLSPIEFRILGFVLDRTILFNKTEEKIPMRHFLKGVYSKSGERFAPPIGASRSTIERSIVSLRKKGLLQTSAKQGETRVFAVICNETYVTHDIGGMSPMTQGYVTHDISKRTEDSKHEISNNPRYTRMNQASDSLRGKVRKINLRHEEARTARKSGTGIDAIICTYYDVLREQYPNAVSVELTKIERAVLRRALTRVPDEDHKKMITYFVVNWRSIIVRHFGKGKTLPRHPNVMFLVKFFHTFVADYSMASRSGLVRGVSIDKDKQVANLKAKLMRVEKERDYAQKKSKTLEGKIKAKRKASVRRYSIRRPSN